MNEQKPSPDTELDENRLIAERRAKLSALRQQGQAYPNGGFPSQFLQTCYIFR